jgi:hypothetical protein
MSTTVHYSKQLVSVEGADLSSGAQVSFAIKKVIHELEKMNNLDWSTFRLTVELDELARKWNLPDTLLIDARIISREEE